MIISIEQLQPDTVRNIVESYVLREGTDYGDYSGSLSDKVEDVLSQLRLGEAVLVYSEEYETVDIRLASDLGTSP